MFVIEKKMRSHVGDPGEHCVSLSRSPAGPFELTTALSNMSDLQSLISASSVLRRVEHCLRTCGALALCRSSRGLLARSPPAGLRLFGGSLLASGSQCLSGFPELTTLCETTRERAPRRDVSPAGDERGSSQSTHIAKQNHTARSAKRPSGWVGPAGLLRT